MGLELVLAPDPMDRRRRRAGRGGAARSNACCRPAASQGSLASARWTSSSSTVRGRPERGASASPSRRRSQKLRRHKPTVRSDTPRTSAQDEVQASVRPDWAPALVPDRQPRDDVFEVASVMGARPRPRHRLGPHDSAVRTAQQPQFALDHAARRAEIQVALALDATVMDHQPAAGLAAARAHPPPAPQADRHDHPRVGEADMMTDAPGRRSSLFNAVLTRMSPSSRGR